MNWYSCMQFMERNGFIIIFLFLTHFIMPSIFLFLFVFQKHAKGQDLFDQIVYHLDLVETDYFGLQFLDSAQVTVCLAVIYFRNDWLFMLILEP